MVGVSNRPVACNRWTIWSFKHLEITFVTCLCDVLAGLQQEFPKCDASWNYVAPGGEAGVINLAGVQVQKLIAQALQS